MTIADLERLGMEKKIDDIVKIMILLTCCLLGTLVICLFSSCDKITVPARASEIMILKASYYSVASLKRDGQWKLTKGVASDGSTFNDDSFTGASRDFDLGSIVRVINLQNGKQAVIKITDRINKRFKGKRIDLSKSVFSYLTDGHLEKGLIEVKVERLS